MESFTALADLGGVREIFIVVSLETASGVVKGFSSFQMEPVIRVPLSTITCMAKAAITGRISACTRGSTRTIIGRVKGQ